MTRFLALVATLIVCATPSLAEGDRRNLGCDDPRTTGSLPMEVHGPAALGTASRRVEVTPPEDSWQEQAQQNAERRRREQAEGCPVD
ncbi:hypothetical protein [Methylobacterium pseudosasicola]|uniref:Secreted protein n=1 Tax=Methylobacterium pseudosasicola TaxID=582667 RepID=A0A1I4NMW2_9HYPH|nr:hypothetical protein [Methylobacterium pseudosasicola]SFM16493.1 hypothetical protein SAMN05192568_102165 [Methylobacterium pseudosasicola]